jgi:predicted DNA-binding protein YlxM (UPF0122 family)
MMSAFDGISAHITARILLQVSEASTADDIRAAFRTLASTAHPDRGGDTSAMRQLIAARDVLLRPGNHRIHQPRRALQANEALGMEEFSGRIGISLTDCWLALPRIKKHGLTLDHPRAEKLARGERNRSLRAEWSQGIGFEQAELIAGSAESAGGGMEDLRQQCRDAVSSTTFAPGQIDEDENELRISGLLKLKHAVKKRDRAVLEMRFEQGLSIKEIAAEKEQTVAAIYESFARMRDILPDAQKRADWVDEHCSIEKLACGVESAPVVLQKDGQTGWDMGSMGGVL